jgi:hypothetical protein
LRSSRRFDSQSGSISGTEDSRELGVGVVRRLEHLGLRAFLDDDALLHHDDLVGDGRTVARSWVMNM